MMLDTESGPWSVQVEVDVNHASRKAYEKRARNAKASARLREKKKEQADQIIKLLEERIINLTWERDYYRDFFLNNSGQLK